MTKNIKITYALTNRYDDNVPNNNFYDEKEHIVVEPPYDFESYLETNNVRYEIDEQDEDLFWVVDDANERTGEAFLILIQEQTDEELSN